jgi:hypothetical protein
VRPRLRRERRALNGDYARPAGRESAHQEPCELASDRLLEATEGRRSGVVDLGQGCAEEFVASLALR